MRHHRLPCRLRAETLEVRLALTTYFVDPAGSDLQSGAAAAPWRTLQHAVESIAPGDTIRVRSGTYAGCRIQNSGLSGQPSVLMADDGATVRVDSAGPKNRHQSGIEVENFDRLVAEWILDGIEVRSQIRYGIDVRQTERITVRHCVAHHNGVTGIFLAFSDFPLLDGNESYANGEHGIYDSNSGDDPTIRGNHLHDNAAAGLHMNGDASQGGDGIIFRARVENNVIHDNGRLGGSGINCDGVTDSLFQNNLLYASLASGMSLYQIDGATGSVNNRVINNTIVVASTGRWALNISDSPGNFVRNNVLISEHPTRGALTIDPASLVGLDSDYNACLSRFTTDDNATRLTLAQWQSATGQDVHSLAVTAAELFVDAAARDYHLRAGSAAVDHGQTSAAPLLDLADLPRPQGPAADIGAYERAAEPTRLIVSNLLDGGAGSLRQAILQANARPGADTIEFQLGSGSKQIGLATPLPEITGDLGVQVPASLTVQIGDGDRFALHAAARLQIAGGGTLRLDDSLLRVQGLGIDVASGTALDVAQGAVVVDYSGGASPLGAIRDYLSAGFQVDGVIWDGPGLMSSAARDDAQGATALGVIDNFTTQYDTVLGDAFGYGLPGGESIPATAILVRWTGLGDADLNGRVDGDDLIALLVGFANHGSLWEVGDFDFSGRVDGDDLIALLVGYASDHRPAAPPSASPAAGSALVAQRQLLWTAAQKESPASTATPQATATVDSRPKSESWLVDTARARRSRWLLARAPGTTWLPGSGEADAGPE